MAAAGRPKQVIYGVYELHDALCFVEQSYGRVLASEIDAVKKCTTVGEALALVGQLKLTTVPGVPDDPEGLVDEGLSPDDPYDWSETGAVIDGDWPVMPTALSLKCFHSEDQEAWSLLLGGDVNGQIVDTSLNGPYLEIGSDKETALVAAFEQLGVQAVRDDATIAALGES